VLLATAVCASAANPFLSAPDDRPVSAKFRGTEWGDEVGRDDAPLRATLVTRRVATMSWGAVFELRFEQMQSRSTPPRVIEPEWFVVTAERIYLLNESNNLEAAERLQKLSTAPEFEKDTVYAVASGSFSHKAPPWETTVKTKGDTCTYLSSHNSGHFKKLVWKRGVGLVEYSMGSGAEADGFRLKRATR
jgi:hypothetical protein